MHAWWFAHVSKLENIEGLFSNFHSFVESQEDNIMTYSMSYWNEINNRIALAVEL